MGIATAPNMKRRVGVRICAVQMLTLLFAACLGEQSLVPAEQATNAAESSQSARRFVSFRQASLALDALETPTVPPVSVGSTLARDLLSSSDPQVVSIDSNGNMIAHKNGTSIVRSTSGATLTVVVNAVTSLQVVPHRIELLFGSEAPVRLIGDGHELTTRNWRWETSNPNIAAASGSTVYAGYTLGTATLTVRSGAAVATVTVLVRDPDLRVRLREGPSIVKRGVVERFFADVPSAVAVNWTSSNGAVLQPVRDGAFYAAARGTADVCAVLGSRQACRRVTVR